MIPLCLILGDSTAVGTAAALAAAGVRCEVHARVGATSADLVRAWQGPGVAARAAIGLGSNDPTSPALAGNLVALRRRISASRVTWIAPYHSGAARIISAIARAFGDDVVSLQYQPTRDRLHPASYRPVASALHWNDLARKRMSLTASMAGAAAPSDPPITSTRRATAIVFQ